MNIRVRQRFGEVLALLLIVTLVGLLISVNSSHRTIPPKLPPVNIGSTEPLIAVRSSAAVTLSHTNDQTTTSTSLQNASATTASETSGTVVSSDKANATTRSIPSTTVQTSGGSHYTPSPSAVTVAKVAKNTTCATLLKPVTSTVSGLGVEVPLLSNVVSTISTCS